MTLRFWFGCGLVALMFATTSDYWLTSVSAQDDTEDARPERGRPRGGGDPFGRGGGPFGGRGGRGGGPGGGPGGMMGRGGGDMTMSLLRVEEVRKEIDLDEEQEAGLRKLGEQMRDRSQDESSDFNPRDFDFRNASEDERREFFEKMQAAQKERVKKMRGQLEEVLFPEQIERLDQIALQVTGIMALAQPEVQEKLGMTEAQKEQLKTVRDEQESKMRDSMRELRESGDRGSMMEKFAELRKGIESAVLDVLTTDQKKEFDRLKGDPFDIDAVRRSMFQGRGGPGGMRGGPGGDRGERGGPGGDRGGRGRGGDRGDSGRSEQN